MLMMKDSPDGIAQIIKGRFSRLRAPAVCNRRSWLWQALRNLVDNLSCNLVEVDDLLAENQREYSQLCHLAAMTSVPIAHVRRIWA